MKKLPVSIQTFEKIINKNCLYIDKTKDIYRLITSGDYIFISRPRRFGKSLLVSALKEIFSGNKELFRGLYIYDKIDWKKFPVIHVDFSLIARNNEEILRISLGDFIDNVAKENNLTLKNKFIADKFKELIEKLSKKLNTKVVILIDEYDKPIIDHITDLKTASGNRAVLREFYSVIKGCDEYINFVFITGVSKFSKVSIFSGLNNLKDITLRKEFATIMGITQEELEKYFEGYINVLAETDNIKRAELMKKIKFWYDGYSWDGVNRLYNPFSILNLFDSYQFNNYWFSSGTTTFLIKLIKKDKYKVTDLENVVVGDMVFDSYDIENIDINSLLLQTGYLSIDSKDKDLRLYTLTYPNQEVKEAFLNHILADFINEKNSLIRPLYVKLFQALKEEKTEDFIKIIKSMMAGIPYKLHIPRESYYQSLFYMILSLMGVKIDLEVLTDKGRVDGVLEFPEKVYVIEFKYGRAGSKGEKLLDSAMKQIEDKRYYEKFLNDGKKIFLLAVGFVDKEIFYRIEVKS